MKRGLPAIMVLAALGAAVLVSRGGRSRESLLPLSRAVAEHEKALDRGAAVVFPLSPDEERRIGVEIDRRMTFAAVAPGTPEAARAGLWKELGMTAAAAPLVVRFRDRYEFRLTADVGENAFAVPGGFVYATQGLLKKMGGDADALLFTLGHEIGHVELGHCADAYRLRAGAKDPVTAVLGGFASAGRIFAVLHFSPSQELEADAYAVRLLRSIGRDPRAGLRSFDALGLTAEKTVKRGSDEVLVEGLADYFKTHPGAWERRAALESEIFRSGR